ncbi:ABC-2 family transporter protein [Corynebacterium kalinowskii]|uniref:ABC-2 family transporter protein n=1 Tax=Corynebacterium kalinowskii TaxID=2675216 RepID=A0A6B8VSZ3_9CORY|nr:YhgE/Pip domain-containing protein [Corynebacterium kalinowskii]QGU02125.1 ABC-2 family transporter protein [Corynebacterium kalinowskii]
MNLFHIGSELRRFASGKLPRAAFVVLTLLPLIFGGLFPWAYWDPITGLKDLPVAVVNSDQGADKDGTRINAGDQVMHKLLQTDKVGFEAATAEQAARGVADGTYYFALELPTDFSQSVLSVNTDQPQSAQIATVYNNANGFIASMLGNQVTNQVVATIDAELGKQASNQLLIGFNTIGDGLSQAADGSGRLKEGVTDARTGASQLADGTGTLSEKSAQLDSGAQQLATGVQQLDTGLKEAKKGASQLDQGLTSLGGATVQLGNGAQQISAGVDQVVTMANQATNAQEQVVAPLVTASAQLRALGVPAAVELANQFDATIAAVNGQGLGPQSTTASDLKRLQEGARTLAYQLGDPNSEYRLGMTAADSGASELASGLTQLSEGSGKLVVGTQTLSDGTTKLVEGTQQLSVGASALRDGLVQLDEGSGELSLKLSDAASRSPKFDEDKRDKASTMLGQMVQTHNTGQTLTSFGVGLAPFFSSLAMFLGGTMMFMVLRPLKRRAIDSGMHPVRVAISSWIPGIVIGSLQATAVWFVLEVVLKAHAVHPIGLWAALVGVSMCFVGVTQAINAFFGTSAGRLLCIILMALQLVSSGGLYPPETQPAFLRWFHHYDPISYSVELFRQMLVGGHSVFDGRLEHSIVVLVLVWLGAMTVTSLSAWRDRLLTLDKLHPELDI